MIKLIDILNEFIDGDRIDCDKCDHSWPIVTGGSDLYTCHECGHDNNPETLAQPMFKEFTKHTGYSLAFKYLGLKNKQHIFAAPIEQIGMMDMIISKAEVVAMIDEQKAYFGLVYLLNGLEQFDATVCLIRKSSEGYAVKPFDDGDSDFANSKTNFIGIVEQGND